MASIFFESTWMSSLDTWPKNATWSSHNFAFQNLAYTWCSLKVRSTYLKCIICSSSLLEYTKISSLKTNTNRSKNGLNTLFIKSIKTAGALVNLKDTTKNSQWPYLVRNAVLDKSPLLILSWWYPDLRSILEKKTSNSLKLDQTNHQSVGRILILPNNHIPIYQGTNKIWFYNNTCICHYPNLIINYQYIPQFLITTRFNVSYSQQFH